MVAQLAFYIFSLFAIASLLLLLRARNLVHAIAWFAVFLIIIAIFFGLLRAPFLALGQLVIFTGGMIAILLIGISFSGMEQAKIVPEPVEGHANSQGKPFDSSASWRIRSGNKGYKIISLLFLLVLLVSIKLFFAKNTMELPVKVLAVQLFGTYWPILAIILLMFLAALLSAVYFLRQEDESSKS